MRTIWTPSDPSDLEFYDPANVRPDRVAYQAYFQQLPPNSSLRVHITKTYEYAPTPVFQDFVVKEIG